jgi:hypothetical protein
MSKNLKRVLVLVGLVLIMVMVWPKADTRGAESRGAYNTFQMLTGVVALGNSANAAAQVVTNGTWSGPFGLASGLSNTAFQPIEIHRDSGVGISVYFATDAATNGSVLATNGVLALRFLVTQNNSSTTAGTISALTNYVSGQYGWLTTNAINLANGVQTLTPYSAGAPWSPQFTANNGLASTNTARYFFVIPPQVLNDAKYLKIAEIEWRGTNTVWVSNITASAYFPP